MRKKKRKINLFWSLLWGNNIYQKFARIYCLVVLLGFGALCLPISWNQETQNNQSENNRNWIFSNLFTSISAFTTTGLTIKPINESFNLFGQFVILILIQVGGLGLVTSWMFIKHYLFKTRKHTIEERLNLHSERGGMSRGNSFEIVMSALKILLFCELIVAILLTFFFYFVEPEIVYCANSNKVSTYKGGFWNSLWNGIFHSVSSINNAGLDILSRNSITIYSKGWGTMLSVIFAISSIIGGIGYPVLYEIKEWWSSRKKHLLSKNIFSLFTKISILMHLLITIISAIAVLAIEGLSYKNSSFKGIEPCCLTSIEKIWQLIYLIISSRSSGFTGLNLNSLNEKTQWILLILMFIGASPASTAGGIRSITLFVIIGKVWINMRGRKSLSIFSRTISNQTIENSFMVFFLSSALVIVSSLIIPNPNINGNESLPKHATLFEASSAFGTSGLSLGVTEHTNWVGNVVLMILMYIGQMGVPNLLLYYTKSRPSKQNISYPEEKLRIA